MEQVIQITDINSCYEVWQKGNKATEDEVLNALRYIHDVADGFWSHEWYFTDGDFPCFEIDLSHLEWKSPLIVPFDHKNEDFEEGTFSELHEYCLLVDFLMRSKEFKRDYTHLENQFNYVNEGKPRRELNNITATDVFWHPVYRFDALHRCILDDDPLSSMKRQISLIEPDKRPFVFYMFKSYLRETNTNQNVISVLEKCLLASASGLDNLDDLPEDLLVHTSEGTFEPCTSGFKSSFPLSAVKIAWDRTRW